MKKCLLIITLILTTLLTICHLNSSAAIYGNYGYTVNDGKATITFVVRSPASEITIPSNIGGYPVIAIGDKVFQGQTGLTSVTVPEGIETIGSNTFKSCYALKNINLPHSLKIIGASAFSDCTSLEEICIPYSVSSIGTYAFENCTRLKGISIPSSLSSVSNGTFYGCSSLEYINIPSTVKTIGWSAFYYQNYSQRPLEVNYYGTEAEFYGLTISSGNECLNVRGWINYGVSYMHEDDYTYTIENDEITLNTIFNNNLNVTIPHTLGGCPVVCVYRNYKANIFYEVDEVRNVELPSTIREIGDYAFYGCNFLQSINIPDNVVEIGNYSFEDCYGLTSIILPENINKIGYGAFGICKNLREISIPEQVARIEQFTFSDCYSLNTVTLPGCLEYIGYDAFSGCTLISEVNFNGTKEQWDNVVIATGNDYLVNATVNCLVKVTGIALNKNKLSLYVYDTATLTATIIPTNATNTDVKWESSNTSVATVSDGVVTAINTGTATITATTIDGNYTASCVVTVTPKPVYVTGVSLNKNNISINIGNSESLTATVLPANATTKTVTWKSSNTSVATVSNGVVTAKGKGTATITVKTVDGNYTASCIVTVKPKVVNVIGVSLNKHNISMNIGGNETLTATVLPIDATTQTVTWKSSNTSVATVSNGVVTGKKIGIATITVTTTDGAYKDTCQVEVGADGVCGKNLTWKLNSSGVITISGTGDMYDYYYDKAPWYTYYTHIKSVVINNGVTSIGEQAFWDYYNDGYTITQVSIPESVISIGDRAFARCISLNEITIPDSVTSLGQSVLRECTELKKVTIGSGVTNINDWMFWNDYKLESINVSENNKYYCDIDGNLYSKDKTVLENYAVGKTATSFVIPEGVITIGYGAFYNCDSLNEIDISDTVTIIGGSAFDNCSNLKSVTIGKGVKEISTFAFDYCENIEDVYYNGTKEKWNSIAIDETNEYLLNASIHYLEKNKPSVFLSAEDISVSGISEECVLIVASYNNHRLVDVKSISVSTDITVLISSTGLNTNGADLIKAFLFEDMQSLKPICEAQSVKIEIKPPTLALTESQVSVNGIYENSSLIIATYNGSTMLDAKVISISSDAIKTIAETGVNTNGADKIKAYLWKDIKNMIPICEERVS